MAAAAEVVADRGFAATRVVDILDRSGVSSRTFYAYFSGLEACFFDMYAEVVRDLENLIAPAPRGVGQCDYRPLDVILASIFEHYSVWPAHAQVLLVEIAAAGPYGAARHEETLARIALRLTDCSRWQPGESAAIARSDVAEAMVGAVARIAQRQLTLGAGTALPAILPRAIALLTSVAIAD